MIICNTIRGELKIVPKEQLMTRVNAYGLITHDNKILVVSMKSNNKYFFPGGEVEKGERLEEALRREAREETGLEIDNLEFFHFTESFFYYDPAQQAFHCYSFYYKCTPMTVDLLQDHLVNDNEALRPRWVKISDLKKDDFKYPGDNVFEKFLSER